MGFSLEDNIDDQGLYVAPDHAFLKTISGMVQSFPWERFERYFEARPLINASVQDQVFILRVLAIQEILCLDDEGVLSWLKNQMYLSAFLSPGYKPKVPSRALLKDFRDKLNEASLLEPFRLRCQNIILKTGDKPVIPEETSDYMSAFAPATIDFLGDDNNQELAMKLEDKWVICPNCDTSTLNKVMLETGSTVLRANCEQCGFSFNL